MACGDPYNPGWLYFSQRGSPDTASDAGYLEVTSPSEPLIGGGHYEGADYVFTDQGVYRVDATSGGVTPFVSHKLSLTYGLAGPWAFTVRAPYIFLVSTVGSIVAYNPAGPSDPLTADLQPLFPHEGEPGETLYLPYIFPAIGGYRVYPPDFARPQYMRLEFVNNQLCFDYVNTAGVWNTAIFDMRTRGWILHFYNPPMSLRYQEEGVGNPLTLLGSDDGKVYYVSPECTDAGVTITSIVVTPADDQGDTRALKRYGDVMFDFQGLVGVQPYYKNLQESPVSGTYTLGPQYPRGQWIVPIISTGAGDDTSWQRNIGLVITWFTSRPT